eukprot:CAMPEP_0119127766 /NCGR_PEP_ID=MMETSP1310-20130426/6186_1 /TAXON_ID=464262 /ORGANISM="Genus nov. species nov., Strain RCC2339" /LENGTH=316 /DNA_ID=CAMNT_0007118047 /DNA_START=25 /DNA_END=972 /DNA_ORIENTATION=-
MADMRRPFEEYIERCEPCLAQAGIGKIVPPREWVPRKAGYEDVEMEVPQAIKQNVTGGRGVYRSLLVECKPMSLKEGFAPVATTPEHCCPRGGQEEVERRFWRNMTFRPPMYAADIEGSLMDEDCDGWNIRNLDTLLTRTLRQHTRARIPGVMSPYLYFGMWRSFFAWHTEDMDLYSMNYLHFGEPKTWYCVPPSDRGKFERAVQSLAPDLFLQCGQFLRHKELMVAPTVLAKLGVKVLKCQQAKREWIINYPGAYHAGFNHGYNCAESTNFATKGWIPIGEKATACSCSRDSVRIDMRIFTGYSSDEEEEDEEEE